MHVRQGVRNRVERFFDPIFYNLHWHFNSHLKDNYSPPQYAIGKLFRLEWLSSKGLLKINGEYGVRNLQYTSLYRCAQQRNIIFSSFVPIVFNFQINWEKNFDPSMLLFNLFSISLICKFINPTLFSNSPSEFGSGAPICYQFDINQVW